MNRKSDARTLVLPRKHLTGALAESVAAFPLVVVAAPMGYGKTILARALSGMWNDAHVFLNIPPNMRDPRHLWRALSTELESGGLIPAGDADRFSGFPATPGQMRNFIEAAQKGARRLLIVMDNYQHAHAAGMDAFFDSLVRISSPGFRVALFSRAWSDSELVAAVKARIIMFGEERLRFSESETAEYFALHGVRDADAAKRAWEYSEGWPVLVWHSLNRMLDAGKTRHLHDLESTLVKSVLSDCGSAECAVLKQLSVMDDFTAGEAAMLTRRGISRLETALAGKSAVFHDTETGRYRFHRLVRNYLAEELSVADGVNLPDLYRRAAECYAHRGDLLAAMRLFLRAGGNNALESAFELFLAPGMEGIVARHYDEIQGAVHALSPRVRARHIMGYLAFLRLSLAAGGHAHDVAWRLAELESELSANGNASSVSRRIVEGEVALIHGLLVFNDAESSLDKYKQAHSLLRGPSAIHPGHLSWSSGGPSPSFAWLRDAGTFAGLSARVGAEEKTLIALSDGHGRDCAAALRLEYHLERGDFRNVERCLREFEKNGECLHRLTAMISACFVKARLLLVNGEADEAMRAVTRLLPCVAESGLSHHSESLELAIAYLNAVLGHYDLVPEWVREGDIFSPPHGSAERCAFLFTLYGRTLLAARDYERLRAVSGTTPLSSLIPRDSLLGRIHKTALEAICLQHFEGVNVAVDVLREAFELSRPDGLVLPLAEYGEEILPLLRSLKKTGGTDRQLSRIISVADSMRRRNSNAFPKARNRSSLTQREHEIMRMVLKGMTNAAIGGELGITRNGIGKCLGLIYAKLGASNRTQASGLYELIITRGM